MKKRLKDYDKLPDWSEEGRNLVTGFKSSTPKVDGAKSSIYMPDTLEIITINDQKYVRFISIQRGKD